MSQPPPSQLSERTSTKRKLDDVEHTASSPGGKKAKASQPVEDDSVTEPEPEDDSETEPEPDEDALPKPVSLQDIHILSPYVILTLPHRNSIRVQISNHQKVKVCSHRSTSSGKTRQSNCRLRSTHIIGNTNAKV